MRCMRLSVEWHTGSVVAASVLWHSVRVLLLLGIIFPIFVEEWVGVGLPLGFQLADALRRPEAARMQPVVLLSKLKKLIRANFSLTVAS